MLRVEYQSERSRAPLIWANFSREGALLATAPEMAPEELQTFTALAQEAAARLQQTPDWMRPLLGQALYVRFGSLPRGGASQDFARGQRLRGVSVYPARADPLEHVLRFDEAHPHTGEHAFTIGTILDRPAWLVTGKEVGIGPDNEPLLDAVTPLVRIQYQPQAGGFLPKSGVGTRARRRLQEILTNERGGISLDRLSPRLAAAASMREPVASAVTPARAEAADLPLLAPGAARMALPDLPDRPPAALAPAAAPDLPDSPPQSAYEVDVQVLGPPGTAAAQGLMPAPEPTAPMPWGQIARSAVRTASRGVLGGLPELAIPAVERMTDPTQVPQTAAGVGEMIGQSAGSAVLPGPGTAIGGTVGAVTGLTAGTLATEGRWPTWKEIGREAVWSAVPEIAESTVRGIVRHIGRGTQGGRLIRLDEAARRARDLPGVFQAPPRQQVGQQFDAVRASGLQLDTGIMQQEIQGLRQGKYEDLLAEVRRIDRGHKTGRRYEQLVENLRNPGPGVRVAGWPVGDLQQLRSAVRARAEELTSHEARQLLEDFQGAVDDAIDAGIARGRVPTGMTVADLQEARRQWARVRAHEDLSTLVERTIDVTPDLTMSSFKLKQLANSLRRNEGPLAQRINRALDQTGTRGAFQRDIEEVSQLYQTVELPLADVFGIWRAPGFAVVRQMISGVLASPTGRQIFRDAIIEGRGRLSLNGFAAAVNAARRESGLVFPAIPGLEAERAGATAPTTPGPGG
jgi:hypothetical protein